MYGRIALLGVGLFSVTLFSPASRAVDVYTDPVGFYQVPALTNSDTFVSLPFLRIPEFRGKIASVLGNILTIAGPQSWSANQWSTVTPNGYYPYFLLITSGTKAGAYYTITNSTASALSVIQIPEDLSGVAVNDQVQVIPFATLGYVFPGGTGVVATTSLGSRKTEVLAPNISGLGINLGYSSTYFFFNSAWRKVGANVNSNYNDTVFLPDQYVVIRQNNGADTTQVTAMGQVALSRIRIPLYSNSFGGPKQDNFVGLVRPSNYSLDQSGLTNAFTATTSLGSRNDELLVFDNSVQQKNKGPSATYFYYNNGWRKVGASVSVNFGASNVFQAASGAIVRKQTNSVLTSVWANDPNY